MLKIFDLSEFYLFCVERNPFAKKNYIIAKSLVTEHFPLWTNVDKNSESPLLPCPLPALAAIIIFDFKMASFRCMCSGD
jgi:hypothetical protein